MTMTRPAAAAAPQQGYDGSPVAAPTHHLPFNPPSLGDLPACVPEMFPGGNDMRLKRIHPHYIHCQLSCRWSNASPLSLSTSCS